MRIIYALLLLIFLGAITIFAVQNQGSITLQFLDRSISSPRSLLIVLIYLLGMLSGWTVVGIGRNWYRHAMTRPSRE